MSRNISRKIPPRFSDYDLAYDLSTDHMPAYSRFVDPALVALIDIYTLSLKSHTYVWSKNRHWNGTTYRRRQSVTASHSAFHRGVPVVTDQCTAGHLSRNPCLSTLRLVAGRSLHDMDFGPSSGMNPWSESMPPGIIIFYNRPTVVDPII